MLYAFLDNNEYDLETAFYDDKDAVTCCLSGEHLAVLDGIDESYQGEVTGVRDTTIEAYAEGEHDYEFCIENDAGLFDDAEDALIAAVNGYTVEVYDNRKRVGWLM